MAFITPSTLLTPTGFDRSAVMRAAWSLARHRAARDGTTTRSEISNALSLYWNNARCEAQRAGRVHKQRTAPSFVASQVAIYGSSDFGRRAA